MLRPLIAAGFIGSLIMLNVNFSSAGESRPDTETIDLVESISLLEFLVEPPNLLECTAQISRPKTGKANIGGGKESYYVLIRRQTNAFLYREAASLEHLNSTNVDKGFRCFGYYGSNYWYFEDNGRVVVNTEDESLMISYPVRKWLWVEGAPFYNCGIMSTLPGTLRFAEDSLIPMTNANGLRMSGFAHRGKEEVDAVTFDIVLEGRTIPWEVEYRYDPLPKLPRGFPSVVKAYVVNAGVKELCYTIQYLSVALTRDRIPDALFDNANLMKRGLLEVRYIKDKGFFKDPGTGKLRAMVASRSNAIYRVAFVLCAIFLGVVAYMKLHRWKETTTKKGDT